MEIRALRSFLAVTREQGVSAAAESLHMAQSTLSRHLIDLEAEVGKKLFLRANKRLLLTEDGLALKKRAEEILELVDRTEAELCQADAAVEGEIYIGCGETGAMRLVADAVKQLRVSSPLIRYHIMGGSADEIRERLEKGLLDFGVLDQAEEAEKFCSLPLPDADAWGLLMKRDSPLARYDRIRPEDLPGIPLLFPRQAPATGALAVWRGKNAPPLRVVTSYDRIYQAALLVKNGVGYALGSGALADVACEDRQCFRPLEPRLPYPQFLVWKQPESLSRAAASFLTRLRCDNAAMQA